MPLRSDILGRAASNVGGGNVLVSTVPNGEVWILKSVLTWNNSGVNRDVLVYIIDAGNALPVGFVQQTMVTYTQADWEGWIVMLAGDKLQMQTNGGGVIVWASGARFVL